MSLHLYNTLTRKIEKFYTINNDNIVKMYSCGPTVYSYPHIGNMRAYVFSDLLKRVLISEGYNVINAINITDVGHLTSDADEGEDKLEKEAKKQNKNAYDIANFFTNTFFDYLKSLNILKANIYPKATDHIQEQINMISVLEEKGFTYLLEDGIYFDTSKFPTYRDFAKLDLEGLEEGNRVTFNENKLNKTDFALWKFSKENEQRQMEWDSPWGKGFPGWHVECSAMIYKHLGEQIDIHTGGIDHIPVHHTNEIAQTEAFTGKKFSNFWLHVNFLKLHSLIDDNTGKEIKMSKSMGNILTIPDLESKGFSPMVVKYFYLTAHYRSELKFNFDILKAAKNTFERLQNKVNMIKNSVESSVDSQLLQSIKSQILNDLNTPKAIALFQEGINNNLISNEEKLGAILYIEDIFGLNFNLTKNEIPEKILKLAEDRFKARLNKEWKKSDILRELIFSEGYKIKDNKNGYDIKKL